MLQICRFWTWLTQHRYVPFCHGLMAIARTGTVYTTMALTLERYFAIARPLFRNFSTIQKVLLIFTACFAVTFNIPKVKRMKFSFFCCALHVGFFTPITFSRLLWERFIRTR